MHKFSPAMQSCIRECLHCYEVCRYEAMNHCLVVGGPHVEPEHFRLMTSCAELCRTCADFMLSMSEMHQHVCAACAEVCAACAASCEKVGDMAECVEACRRCERTCREMAAGRASALEGSQRQASAASAKAPM